MSEDTAQPEFRLHFEGEATRGHRVPAAALVKVVQALQKSIQWLAFAYEGQGESPGQRQRLRLSYEMERKYAVTFGLPEDGGYVLPYRIGDTAHQLIPPDDVKTVTHKYETVLQAVQVGDLLTFRREVTDANIRRKFTEELNAMQPPARTGLVVSIEDVRRRKILDGNTVSGKLLPLLVESPQRFIQPLIQPRVITGRLDALDFEARTLRLKLPTARILSATYGDYSEPILLENARGWIQVRGEVTLNEDGTPYALHNISDIIEVDTSPIVVASLRFDQQSLPASQPLEFAVTFDPAEGTYTATGPFHVVVSAETRAELEATLDEELALLWEEYAVSEEPMSEDAIILRDQLVEAFGRNDAT